ncbi:hypothetical protein E2C01_097689 [Portunus trituberculatus]|uniref:Uncharacterized protein n=1 Tax=Portunus trituberculatus TaxID=210409 RepID=A0A5B7K531_PORTR|nr:hypothetical protein [Portunus trituberculatus]
MRNSDALEVPQHDTEGLQRRPNITPHHYYISSRDQRNLSTHGHQGYSDVYRRGPSSSLARETEKYSEGRRRHNTIPPPPHGDYRHPASTRYEGLIKNI